MATDLATKTPGGTDDTYQWLLHTSGTAISAGAQIGDGAGNDSGLKLHSDKIGIVGATNTATLGYTGTTDRAITLPDYDGELDMSSVVRLASNASVNSTTLSTIASFAFTPEASTYYTFDIRLLIASNNSSYGVKVALTGPTAQTSRIAYGIGLTDSSNIMDFEGCRAFGTTISNTTWTGSGHIHYAKIEGIFITTGTTPASDVEVQIANESASGTTTVYAGSSMRFNRV